MRGKPHYMGLISVLSRITPADAGKTKQEKTQSNYKQDHPRGCGENLFPARKSAKKMGSPPRMRGKREIVSTPAPEQRITPADAGKTLKQRTVYKVTKDHPRGCGENGFGN